MKKFKNSFPLFIIGIFVSATLAFTVVKPEDHGLVHWMKFSEAVEKCKKQPRMIIIDIYTKWCGPCKMLTAQTFGNEKIAKYMNDNFYCVKFDAETRDTVKFSMMIADTLKDKAGKVKKITQKAQEYKFFNTYPPEASRSTHQFAASILSGHQIAFPSVVFLTKDVKRVDVIQGFYPPAQFEPIVKFFGSGSWENTKYEEFQKNFKSELNTQ